MEGLDKNNIEVNCSNLLNVKCGQILFKEKQNLKV